MNNKEEYLKEIKVLDKGLVKLVDFMGSDQDIVAAARVSYQKGTKKRSSDKGLIRYLMRHHHGTPFEMVALKFYIKAPIFVFRQWHRHRIGISINEVSARYSELPNECYVPELERIQIQSKNNKQGSDTPLQKFNAEMAVKSMEASQGRAFDHYHNLLRQDIARELARINLPVSTYSEMFWACNLRSLFAFCELRMDPHSQYEIRVYADAMFQIVKELCPLACEAFEDYRLNAVSLSAVEIERIREFIDSKDTGPLLDPISPNKKGEDRELQEFRKKLGIE